MLQVDATNAVTPEEALHVRFHVSDCTYRHSYPPCTKMSSGPFGKRKGTASIPIDRQSMRKTASEHQMAIDEAEADYKDFVFFSRVVDGISRQNSLLQDGSYLKSTNNILIDNIVRSRHEVQKENFQDDLNTHYYEPQKHERLQAFKVVTPTRTQRMVDTALELAGRPEEESLYAVESPDYEEDEGVFDFEL